MLPKNRPPVHPGEILAEEFLKPKNISQLRFAAHLGWPYARVNEIVNGKRGITPETALAFSDVFGTTPDLWLTLQQNYELWYAQQKHKRVTKLAG
ncbi:HigA family addiction module antitoxin [Bdellovibrionota bacterium FG-2]